MLTSPSAQSEAGPQARAVQTLPFTVRIVRDEASLLRAVKVRHEAYARHMPDFAQALKRPEPDDTEPDCTLWIAESKVDGAALGTMRVQTNARRPLSMERSVRLPEIFQGKLLGDARRLAISQGTHSYGVMHAMFKASFLFMQRTAVEWSLVTARHPLNRVYQRLLFTDALGGQTYVPESMAAHNNHQVLAFEIEGALNRWQAAQHPLTGYLFETDHPDLLIN